MRVKLSELTDRLARECIDVKEGRVVILADNTNMNIGESLYQSVRDNFSEEGKSDSYVSLLNADNFRNGKPMKSLPEDMKVILEKTFMNNNIENNAFVYINSIWDGEQPMRKETLDFMKDKGKLGGLGGCNYHVLFIGLHPQNRQAFGEELQEFVQREKSIIIRSDNGTDLCVDLNTDMYKVINSNGKLKAGAYRNPIMGEVYTHPESANGTLIISGSYGPLLTHEKFRGKYKELTKALNNNPITWKIKHGEIIDIKCNDKFIKDFVFKKVFEDDPIYGCKIGELGLPTNLYALEHQLSGQLLIDEKGRVHIANGHGYPTMTGAKYETAVHGDGLIANANLFSTRLGVWFMRNNQYNKGLFTTLK